MKPLHILCNLGFLILGVLFSLDIINIYWVNNDWHKNIINLGNTRLGRNLMSTHFFGGIFCMFFYTLQKIIVEFGCIKHKIVKYVIHIPIGILLFVCAMITSICGFAYIITQNTIGGLFMDISFAIYGLLLFFTSLYGLMISYQLHTFDANFDDIFDINIKIYYKKLKFTHYAINNIYGALIFSSLFYRILYIYSGLFGYSIPSNITPSTYYERPLDRSFQVLFYVIPIIFTTCYNIMIYNNTKNIAIIFRTIMILAIIVTIVALFI